MSAKYAGAVRLIEAIEQELRRIGRWRTEPLPPEALEFSQAFAADTMPFEHWLQFVLLPRVRGIIAERGDFPERSQVGTYAVRAFDGDDQAAGLIALLAEFDEFITGEGEEPESAAPPREDDPFAAALALYRTTEFQGEVLKICRSLDRTVSFDVDWDSVAVGCRTPEERMQALKHLMYRGVADVRSAILLLDSNYGPAASMAVAESLRGIRLEVLAPDSPPRCTFADGVLSIETCLRTHAVRELKIGQVLADAFDLRVGPRIEELNGKTIPEHEAHLREVFDSPIAVEVDFASFRAEPDADRQLEALGNCAQEGVYYLCYALESAGRDEAMRSLIRARVTTLRIRHVGDPAERELWAEGSTILLAVRLHTDSAGRFGEADLEEKLPGVLAGMPAPALPPGESEAVRLLAECLKIAATCQGRISEALGAPVTFNVDWPEVAGDPVALSRLPRRALQRVTGAILLCASSFAAVPGAERPHTVNLRFVRNPGARACRFRAGTLDVAVCLTPRPGATINDGGFFYEQDLAKFLRDRLGLETTPMIDRLTDEVLPGFLRRLAESIGVEAAVTVEWDGFLAGADTGRNKWAIERLEQDCLDHLYYALTGLAEKGADFARLIRCRVRAIRIQHVGKPALKALLADGSTLLCRVFLTEGYDGRLTIDEMRKMLPGILADMPDGPDPRPPRDPGEPPVMASRPPPLDPRLFVLQKMIEEAIGHLSEGSLEPFLLMFMPAEVVATLWQDGGESFRKLLADLEPRRETFLWALRRCLEISPELTADGHAIYRFEDRPPGITLGQLVFRESGARWLLDVHPEDDAQA